jgi:hypothetical protein
MRIFLHNPKQNCECAWSVFYKNMGGLHVLHVLGLRFSWGSLPRK